MKLYLDDVRDSHDPDAITVRKVEHAKVLIEAVKFEHFSLDHDMGAFNLDRINEPTGYDLLMWMIEHGHMPEWFDQIQVHSMNPVGKERMQNLIRDYYRGAFREGRLR